MTVTPEEAAVLAKAARQLGRRWKTDLAAIWANGCEAGRLRLTEGELVTLRRIRNNQGPSVLRTVRLPRPSGGRAKGGGS